MKEAPVSICERNFILEALAENIRLDGRNLTKRRPLEIFFGGEWGSALVILGGTRVLAQVSCTITEPRATRPNEGILLINVELSSMASPKFELQDRSLDEGVELNRLMERCLKESKCLDMESLCIVAEEKVWCVRLDLHILNHEGNLADCASVAGLAALCHFRRPDVTLSGDKVTVHPISERDPVKLAVHHHPVCSTFAFFENPSKDSSSKIVVYDPSHKEEAVMDGKLVLGVNPYREICTLHLAGQTLIDKGLVVQLAFRAAGHAKEIVDQIKNALVRDETSRKSGEEISLANALRTRSILANSEKNPKELDLSYLKIVDEKKTVLPEEKMKIVDNGQGVIDLVPDDDDDDDDESDDDDEPEIIKVVKKKKTNEDDDGSEEDEVVMIGSKELEQNSKSK